MTLNTFDSDGQCGYNRNWDSAGADPNLAFVPDDQLYFNSVDIRDLIDRVDKLDVHTFGPQDVKYRFWKIDDVGLNRNGEEVSCGESFLGRTDKWRVYHDDKLYWNGYRAAVDNCATEDITHLATVSKGDNALYFDFGVGNKYAVTSITQDTDQYRGIIKYFSVYASNDNFNWEKICTFEGVPDPRAVTNPNKPPASAGTPTPHCLIIREDNNNFYPSSESIADTGLVSKTETHAQKIVIRDLRVSEVTTANIFSRALQMEVWADGLLFDYGTQYKPVRNITGLVSYSGIAGNAGDFSKPTYLSIPSTTNGTFTILFPPNQPQNVTSLKFRAGSTSYAAYPTSFAVDFYNDCGSIFKTVNFDSDHVISELDGYGETAASTLDYGKHFVLLESAQSTSVFPGNAARLWKAPVVSGGGGSSELLYEDLGALPNVGGSDDVRTIDISSDKDYYRASITNTFFGTPFVSIINSVPVAPAVKRFHILLTLESFNHNWVDITWVNFNEPAGSEGGTQENLCEFFSVDGGLSWYGINYGAVSSGLFGGGGIG